MTDIWSFQSHQTSLDRRPKRFLNPIIEENDNDPIQLAAATGQQTRQHEPPHLQIEAWLSPMSDHFPTPRGFHYLSAPVLPSSPSTVSAGGSSATTSSSLWKRASSATENTEFEDLYDVSDEENDGAVPCCEQKPSITRIAHNHSINQPLSRQPTRLIIPAKVDGSCETCSAVDELKKITSPLLMTPPVQLPMSPAQVDFMGKQQTMEIPTASAPPSLDGSVSSEQLAAMSAPATPVTGNDEQPSEANWAGVHLQPDALATLRALSGAEVDISERPAGLIEVSMRQVSPSITEMRQQPLPLATGLASQTVQGRTSSIGSSRRSLADLTRLDIPSPSAFFSKLSPRSRGTWHPTSKSPVDLPPPTSTTAEQFYRCLWRDAASIPPIPKCPDSAEGFYRCGTLSTQSSQPVEQVIEMAHDGDCLTDEVPTAKIVPGHGDISIGESISTPVPPECKEATRPEIVVDYDLNYPRKQPKEALNSLNRTEIWLMAQRAYFGEINGHNDDVAPQSMKTLSGEVKEEAQEPTSEQETGVNFEAKDRVVRFSCITPNTMQPKRLPAKLSRRESAYYRAFQDYVVRTQLQDVFVQQMARFEALQAQRTALRETHRNQLLGKYQLSVVPQSAKKRLSANVARGDLVLVDDPEKLRKEKEFEAMNQMTISTWHVAALKFLNGGRLITAPVSKRLARLSSPTSGQDGVFRERARILDLGGQSACDWAWHCALQYPNAKIYSVTTKAIRQLSNANVRGPPNHRQVAVKRLTKLPFADGQFDLVSARELHGILKFFGENGEDEWDSCLKECMRVLKPGGYLEFSIMDSDVMNAGPLGLAKSVEFGFALKTLGYDPSPSKLWLIRLARAGFVDIRRAWLCLPMGAKRKLNAETTLRETDSVGADNSSVSQTDALMMGSSDCIANVCSILGGWSWERWLLRCEMEKVAGELRLSDTVTAGETMREAGKCLDGIHAVMEEGRGCKAGFRMLKGYARKPKRCSDVIRIGLAP